MEPVHPHRFLKIPTFLFYPEGKCGRGGGAFTPGRLLHTFTHSKGRRGREAFSIHPSVPSSIHAWHHTGKKTLAEINNPQWIHAECGM